MKRGKVSNPTRRAVSCYEELAAREGVSKSSFGTNRPRHGRNGQTRHDYGFNFTRNGDHADYGLRSK